MHLFSRQPKLNSPNQSSLVVDVVPPRNVLVSSHTMAGESKGKVDKQNQDRMFVHQNFTGEAHRHLVGVCDGHGMLGHHVSGVLRTEVP